MSKRYNTPHRTHIIKTRVTEEEHADFMERLTAYGMAVSLEHLFKAQRIPVDTVHNAFHGDVFIVHDQKFHWCSSVW